MGALCDHHKRIIRSFLPQALTNSLCADDSCWVGLPDKTSVPVLFTRQPKIRAPLGSRVPAEMTKLVTFPKE